MTIINGSLEEMKEAFKNQPEATKGWSIFNFAIAPDFNSTVQYGQPEYVPALEMEVAHGIGLYYPAIRDGYPRNRKIHEDTYTKLIKRPNLSVTKEDNLPQDCKLILYVRNGPQVYPTVSIAMFQVSIKECKDNHCQFDRARALTASWGNLCGVYSHMGAPVVCGQGSNYRLKYIVTGRPNTDRCDTKFTALDITSYSNDIMKRVREVEDNRYGGYIDVKVDVSEKLSNLPTIHEHPEWLPFPRKCRPINLP